MPHTMKKTLLLSARYSEDSISLRGAAIEEGYDVIRLQHWRAPKFLNSANVVLYGEVVFVLALADQFSLRILEPQPHLLAQIPYQYLQRKVRFLTYSESKILSSPFFIKPAAEKFFPAGIYRTGADLPTRDELYKNFPVLTSEIVNFTLEFRAFVLDREILTISPYVFNGALAKDSSDNWLSFPAEQEAASVFLNSLLRDSRISLPPALVADVGFIKDVGWALVEFNTPPCSGLCACQPSAALSVISRSCIPSLHVTDADQPWIINPVQQQIP